MKKRYFSSIFVYLMGTWHFWAGKQAYPQSMQELFNFVIKNPLDFHSAPSTEKQFHGQNFSSFLRFYHILATYNEHAGPVSCVVFQMRIKRHFEFSYSHINLKALPIANI